MRFHNRAISNVTAAAPLDARLAAPPKTRRWTLGSVLPERMMDSSEQANYPRTPLEVAKLSDAILGQNALLKQLHESW